MDPIQANATDPSPGAPKTVKVVCCGGDEISIPVTELTLCRGEGQEVSFRFPDPVKQEESGSSDLEELHTDSHSLRLHSRQEKT